MSALEPLAAPAMSARAQASGSSFYTAMRLLPRAEREAMFAIYGFCRAVDDIADEPGLDLAQRRAALDGWRSRIDSLDAAAAGQDADLAAASRRFGLARADFLAIIEGMAMDVEGPIVAPDFATFDLYCDRVASAVGRLGVRVFGMDEAPGEALAHHLGRALQFTNVLRDLDEDAAMGRLYLPAEALAAAGLRLGHGGAAEAIGHPDIDAAARWLLTPTREHYAAAFDILDSRPAGRLAAPRLMAEVYLKLLTRMELAGWAPPRVRARIRKRELLRIVLRHGWRG